MIVSFGTCDLKLYTVKFLLFVCSFFSYVLSFVFATACTYCFHKGKDIVNVSVEGDVRKEKTEEKARVGERGEGGARASERGALSQAGTFKGEK